MPDNGSGFVSFDDYYNANKDEEDRQLQAALERARNADADTSHALMVTSNQAEGLNGLSSVGSYTDYLAAKQKAENAWAQVQAGSTSPYEDAVRSRLRDEQGVGAEAQNAADLRQGNLQRADTSNAMRYAAAQKDRAAYAAWQQQQATQKAQQDATNQSAAAYQEAQRQRIRQQVQDWWAKQDKRASTFGFGPDAGYTVTGGINTDPNKNQGWGSDSAALDQLKQQAQTAGIYDELNSQGAWDVNGANYTFGKRDSGTGYKG